MVVLLFAVFKPCRWIIRTKQKYYPKFNILFPYRGGRVLVLNFEEIHRSNHALHGHKDVLKDQLDEAAFVFFRVPRSMNNPHLFYKCRFPRFSCAWNFSKNCVFNYLVKLEVLIKFFLVLMFIPKILIYNIKIEPQWF